MQLSTDSFLKHFQAMEGPFGLYQHATSHLPLLSEGYCTDDNARAILVLLKLKQRTSKSQQQTIDRLLSVCWQFVLDAQHHEGEFYNFRDAKGAWLSPGQSEDMYARIMRACAALLAASPADQDHAWRIFSLLLPRATHFSYVRSAAEGIVASAELPPDLQGREEVRSAVVAQLATLKNHWQQHASATWPWFESQVTYANALLPHGVLAAWQMKIATDEIAETLHASTEFLVTTTVRNFQFIPVGSVGWYQKGGTPSVDNQQPIEAGVTFDFLLEYEESFPGRLAPEAIAAPYLWFFGKNTQNQLVAIEGEGASLDGLFLEGPNRNRGAESMLAYLWTELRLHDAPPAVSKYVAAERARLSESAIEL